MVDRLDAFQRRHRWVGLPLAVIYKFFDDQGPYLAALITYYGFLALFPLLLIFVTVLGFVLGGQPQLQQQLVDSALGQFPLIGDRLQEAAHPLEGSGVGLVIGILIALYGGLGVGQAIQNAFNIIWGIPRNERPDPLRARLRGLLLLFILAAGVVVTTALGAAARGIAASGASFGLVRVGGIALSVAAATGLCLVAFRVLTARAIPLRQLLSGALGAAMAWQVLQAFGAYYIERVLTGTDELYGLFGLVFGLLAWIYLQAIVLVLVTEVIVVRAQRLWPRALLTPMTDAAPLSGADKRAYRQYARAQRFKGYERIDVDLSDSPQSPGAREPD